MSRPELSAIPIAEGTIIPEVDVALKQAISFSWGTFRVSQAAQEAYSLTALQENVITKDFPEVGTAAIRPTVDIWLLSPEEIAAVAPEDRIVGPKTDLSIRPIQRPFLHQNGVGLATGFSGDLNEVRESMKSNILENIGIDEEHLIVVTHEGESEVSIDEYLEHATPSFLVTELSKNIFNGLGRPLVEWQRKRGGERLLAKLRGAGMMALGANGLLLGDAFIEPNLAAGDYALATLITGYLAAKAALYTRFYVKRQNENERAISLLALQKTLQVANDVHTIYSVGHFDEQAKGWLDADGKPKVD